MADNSPELSHDAVVWQILRDLREAVSGIGDGFHPLARAAELLRTHAIAPRRPQISPVQRDRIVEALRAVFNANYAVIGGPSEQGQFLTSMNALATLALSWAGDSRWPLGTNRIEDARDFALAFELEMRRYAVLFEMLARRNAANPTTASSEGTENARSE